MPLPGIPLTVMVRVHPWCSTNILNRFPFMCLLTQTFPQILEIIYKNISDLLIFEITPVHKCRYHSNLNQNFVQNVAWHATFPCHIYLWDVFFKSYSYVNHKCLYSRLLKSGIKTGCETEKFFAISHWNDPLIIRPIQKLLEYGRSDMQRSVSVPRSYDCFNEWNL